MFASKYLVLKLFVFKTSYVLGIKLLVLQKEQESVRLISDLILVFLILCSYSWLLNLGIGTKLIQRRIRAKAAAFQLSFCSVDFILQIDIMLRKITS